MPVLGSILRKYNWRTVNVETFSNGFVFALREYGLPSELLIEEAGLGSGGWGGFAAGNADDTEDGEFGDGWTRDVDAVGVGIEVGRGEVEAVVEKGEQVVRDDALEDNVIAEADLDPEAVEFGAA